MMNTDQAVKSVWDRANDQIAAGDVAYINLDMSGTAGAKHAINTVGSVIERMADKRGKTMQDAIGYGDCFFSVIEVAMHMLAARDIVADDQRQHWRVVTGHFKQKPVPVTHAWLEYRNSEGVFCVNVSNRWTRPVYVSRWDRYKNTNACDQRIESHKLPKLYKVLGMAPQLEGGGIDLVDFTKGFLRKTFYQTEQMLAARG